MSDSYDPRYNVYDPFFFTESTVQFWSIVFFQNLSECNSSGFNEMSLGVLPVSFCYTFAFVKIQMICIVSTALVEF